MKENERSEMASRLRKQVCALMDDEERRAEQRELLVQYIKLTLQGTRGLPRRQLHGYLGLATAHGITGLIAMQEWITLEDEPDIFAILECIAPLELFPEESGYDWQKVEDQWHEVFELSERLN